MTQAKARTLSLVKRGMSFETVMWLFTRLTALAMYGFIFIGIAGALLMGAQNDMTFVEVLRWVLMPNAGHVAYTNVPDLAPWATTFWKVVACGFFLTAITHGIHGVIEILDDYFSTEKQRQWIRILNISMLLVIGPIGLYVIWTA
jgi:succinate dehydrogenase hydrophobic anchor subunit